MNLLVSGINYRTTPIEIREKLNINGEEKIKLLSLLKSMNGIEECIILSTCNRTEIYICVNSQDFDNGMLEKQLCDFKGVDIYDFKKYFYAYRGSKAVRHLFKVACGLDSLVIGEDQILCQVKSALNTAKEAKTSGSMLNTLFRYAVTAAKKIKTDTGLSKKSLSIGSLAVKLAEGFFQGEIENKSVLVIGTGKIGAIVLKNLHLTGIKKIYVTTRTHGKAEQISRVYKNVKAVNYQDRYSLADECDIVISSTSSPHYTITRDMLEKNLLNNKRRIFIDLAVPRDFDPEVKKIDGVFIQDMDDLKAVVQENLNLRVQEAEDAGKIIDEAAAEYEKWVQFRENIPLLEELHKYTNDLIMEKMDRSAKSAAYFQRADKDFDIETVLISVNSILDKISYQVRKHCTKEDMEAYFRCLKAIIREADRRKNE